VYVVERRPHDPEPGRAHPLVAEAGGYHAGWVPSFTEGSLYSFRLGDGSALYPDPAAKFQPEGPHGPSQVVDHGRYHWKHGDFAGASREGSHVLYEMHIGTFTREGTYAAAREQLAELAELGVTILELMPLAEFPGRFGWGYDGVDLWAPTHLYGSPDELRAFIDAAHGVGLAVILDVVYNHLGPDGNDLPAFSPAYFTDRYANEWGEPLNFDGPDSGPVREFFVANARYWIEAFHFDGLRLDATQSMFDASDVHVIADIAAAAREAGRTLGKSVYLVAENEPQEARLVRPRDAGGYDCDALWNDDFHHAVRVAVTGKREAYYRDYGGTPQELISAVKWGYLFQGQHYAWQRKCRGQPALDLSARNYVTCLENHDQVANSATGARLHALTSPAMLRATTTFWLLAPPTPMLFQGQEFASSAPFVYFCDHHAELAPVVERGRREFLEQFPSIASPVMRRAVAPSCTVEAFERCKLDFAERRHNAAIYAMHRDLLRLRRSDPVFSAQRADLTHGAVLAERTFLLRTMQPAGDRLILVNFGSDLALSPCPEPLLAPPEHATWKLLFSSEHPNYGGLGYGPIHRDGQWTIPATSTHVFAAETEA